MVTLAHDGDIEYIPEATYGAGIPFAGQLEIPSDSVMSSTLEVRRVVKRHHTISTDAALDTTYHGKVYVLTINYALQQLKSSGAQHLVTTSLAYFAQHRTTGDLSSLAMVYDTNGSAYLLKGSKVNTYAGSMTQDNEIPITVEIWSQSLQIEDVPTDFTNYSGVTASAAIGEAIEIFEGASVTRAGSWAAGIQAFNFTIDNHMDRVPLLGSDECVGVYPAHMELGGSVDIITVAGGEVDVEELMAGTEVSIVANSGTTASKSHKWTFTKASYSRTPVIYAADMSAQVISADWGAEDVTYAAYS